MVNNGLFTSDPALVNVTVNHLNQKPVADAGTAQPVKERAPVTLNGAASYEPEGSPLSYAWSNLSTDSACANATATAPVVGSAGAICSFSLTVSDEKGLASAPATVAVTVQNVNHTPVAHAGPDQTVSAKDTVVLNASGSKDPDNEP